jgi:acyl-CoA thioester hydrolase
MSADRRGPAPAHEAVIEVEVRYAETDQMGVVHHSNYFVWFELARTRLCNETGFHYADIERMGYLLSVVECDCRFLRSALYGDHVAVHCHIDRLTSRTVRFAYEVLRGDETLAVGSTHHVWLRESTGRPCRIPEALEGPFLRLTRPSTSPG